MRAVWFEGGSAALRDDLTPPEPGAGEVLVRVIRAGICGTDRELLRGYADFRGIPGHEFVGVVERGPAPLQGRRVVGEINTSCGVCNVCRAVSGRHCPRRTVLGIVGRPGAFAEYLCLPEQNLHCVPEGVNDARAVFAEPLAAALEIQEQVAVRPSDRVLVVGDGRLGQLVARTLSLTGCELLVTGRHPDKLRRLDALGIPTAPSGDAPGGSFDVAVECSGDASGFEAARSGLRPRGVLVLKSTYHGGWTGDLSSLVVDEITVVGSRCGPFAPALQLLEGGRLELDDLIDSVYPLSDALPALERAGAPGALKVLLEMDAGTSGRSRA